MNNKSPKKILTKTALRRERVKQAMLTRGFSRAELAAEEGISIAILDRDIISIKKAGILEEAQEKTALAYLGYSEDVDWAIDEAKRLHGEDIDTDDKGEETGGRLDCLTFVAARRKEEIEVAQKLGLLEVAAEKHQVTHKVNIDLEDSKLVKEFGDWLASKSD